MLLDFYLPMLVHGFQKLSFLVTLVCPFPPWKEDLMLMKTDDGKALPNVAASKVDTYCHDGDNICVNGDLILLPHLTYAENAAAAAAFVVG